MQIQEAAKKSVGMNCSASSFELQQIIRMANFIKEEISLLDSKIKNIIDSLNTPLMSIPGLSYVIVSIILSEIGSIERFSTPDKLLAFAGLDPTVYQSGDYSSSHSFMVKRGSKYLCWAVMITARLVSTQVKVFKEYLNKKLSENKHYFVATVYTAKKLLRVIYYLLKRNEIFKA
ncbi:transposase [Fusobacterium varium]